MLGQGCQELIIVVHFRHPNEFDNYILLLLEEPIFRRWTCIVCDLVTNALLVLIVIKEHSDHPFGQTMNAFKQINITYYHYIYGEHWQ